MKFRFLIALLSVTLATSVAYAQLGIYGNFDTTHQSNNSANATTWFYGPKFGAYYNFLHFGPLALGADLRGDLLWGSDHQKYASELVGLRLAAKPLGLPIRPYVQGSVGAGGSNYGRVSTSSYSQKFLYQIFGGVDVAFSPHLDFRVAEVGYGRMSGIAAGQSAPTDSVLSISTGLVVRFR